MKGEKTSRVSLKFAKETHAGLSLRGLTKEGCGNLGWRSALPARLLRRPDISGLLAMTIRVLFRGHHTSLVAQKSDGSY